MCLEKYGGYEVVIFSSADEALRGMEEAAPDLILLDIMLPGMDGRALYSKLREIDSFKETPVVFLTAKVGYLDEPKELYNLGAVGVLGKPFDPVTLTQSIEDIWRNYVENN
ncbi:MAG: response regulator [Deltaproteobacteria bacterium]|nr:MAG: response regulator [Deltaproteobacteria bacterium]